MKMHKKVLKVAVMSALAVAFTVPAFANPFTDVPAKHWSYDAVNKLAQEGIVDGYGDGTFKGDKLITRYEMAQIVAKAMTKKMNADQQASVDKLSQEYATELNTLGVKVDGMQNQINNMVKVSGDIRGRYSDVGNNAGAGNSGDSGDLRARVSLDGKVNDNITFNTRLSGTFGSSQTTGSDSVNNNDVNIQLDTANVTFNKLFTVGRQDVTLGSGILFDDELNGLAVKTGGLKLYAGKTTGINSNNTAYVTTPAYTLDAEKMYAGEYRFGAINKINLTADYLKIDENKAYAANASIPLGKALTVQGDYVRNITNAANATAVGLKFNKLGLTVTHRNADANVYTAYSNANSFNSDAIALPCDVKIKGMEYQYDKELVKNLDLNVKYQNFDNMDSRTSAAVTVKF